MKPYFRDWTNMQYSQGKTFVAPRTLLRAQKALYFPNLRGYTLADSRGTSDTTAVLAGKISVVSVHSNTWAEQQTHTFVRGGEVENALKYYSAEMTEVGVQSVEINIEEDWMKAGLIRLFLPSLRKRVEREKWGRYFVVRRGVGLEVREELGLVNEKVGYVYLVDESCKIRWAGSGVAEYMEKEGLIMGLRKLVLARRVEGEKRKGMGPVEGKVAAETFGEKESRALAGAGA